MNIPSQLLNNVQEGKVVLVLGAGASVGATNAAGETPPTAAKLAKLLSDEFLGGENSSHPLPVIAELAISESDLPTVQEFIRTVFRIFGQPLSMNCYLHLNGPDWQLPTMILSSSGPTNDVRTGHKT